MHLLMSGFVSLVVYLHDLLSKFLKSATIHDHQMQHIPVIRILQANVCAKADKDENSSPATARGC